MGFCFFFFFFQAEDGIRDKLVTGVQTCALPIWIRVLVDPLRGKEYGKYRGCSAMTPNRLEAGLATGCVVQTGEQALAAAARLLEQLDMEAGIITLDKDGMALVHRDGRSHVFPTRPRQV